MYDSGHFALKSVNMNFQSIFITNREVGPWIRVDLEELYYVYEVMIWTRHDCCSDSKQDLHVRAGRLVTCMRSSEERKRMRGLTDVGEGGGGLKEKGEKD